MKYVYVIKDAKTDYPSAVALDEDMAGHICQKMRATTGDDYNFKCVSFFAETGTVINIIAPPIPKEYLTKLM